MLSPTATAVTALCLPSSRSFSLGSPGVARIRGSCPHDRVHQGASERAELI